uniref:Predicted protein n=1 Tax=Hordeum vulgare subsp. vulgare TaxID=112509 RepID=F2D272_HORVV|nr:predicted protein [Hordeum vulgare subsp. vulgare]
MPATMPLTFSPPHLLLLRRRQAKVQQPRSTARLPCRLRCVPDEIAAKQQQGEEEEELVLLASYRTDFNEVIMVIDSPSNRYLVLDPTRNVHSILPKKSAWTNSYWDECVSLPTVVPRGPVAILGCWYSSTYDARSLALDTTYRMGDRSDGENCYHCPFICLMIT